MIYLAHKWGLTGYYDSSIPLSIPGCQLWLDGADPAASGVVPANGATVSTWVDKSGNGLNATVAPSRIAGTYSTSFRAVNFATSNTGYITNYSASPTNETMFVVFNNPSPSGNNNILIGGLQGARSLGAGFSPIGEGTVGNLNTQVAWLARTGAGTYTAGTTALVTSQFTTSTNSISLNGGTAATGGAPGFTAGRVTYLGVDATNASFYYIGYAMEIIFYNSVLTTTQRQTIEGYLAKKWGITSMYPSIPSTHPFSSIRPHLRTFQPSDVPGCQLWLDAADQSSLTFSGSSITQWNDKSGNGYNMNTIAGSSSTYWSGTPAYPTIGTSINGLQTVNFKAQSGLKQATTLDGVKNLFGIVRIAAPDGSGSAPNYFLLGHDSVYDWSANAYGDKFLYAPIVPSGINNASASLFTSDANAVTNTAFQNVYLPSAPNVSLLSVSGITGTTRYQGICYDRDIHIGWCGDLAEVLIFSTALTTSQRQQVEGYLAHKWGLTTPIPSTHPFKSFPPASLPFSPRNISGLALWLDAADQSSMTLSGSNVTQWNDKSGNGNNATPYSTSPQRSGNSILFSGANALKCGAFLTSTSYSVFIVNNFTSGVQRHSFGCWKVEYGSFIYIEDGSMRIGVNNSVNYNLNASNSTANFRDTHIYGLTLSSSSTPGSSFTFNGSIDGSNILITGTSTSGNATTCAQEVTIGGLMEDGEPKYQLNGNVYEVIVFNTALTTSQRQQVEGYLAQKWGLTTSLPATHPYKKLPA